jgi:uncharacterized protein YlxW (UPF0749 family)
MKKVLFTLALFGLSTFSSQAQDDTTAAATEVHTIQSTFDNIIKESNKYQDYKVVQRRKLDAFIKEVNDSLNLAKVHLAQEAKVKGEAQDQVLKLRKDLEKAQAQVTQAENARDRITSAGMQMEKESFSALMWGIVIALGLALALVLFKSQSASSGQKDLRHRLTNIEEQLSQTKKKALEREQELKREVQDYVNKLEALKPPR